MLKKVQEPNRLTSWSIVRSDPVFCSHYPLYGLIAEGIKGYTIPNAFLNLFEGGFDGRAFVADQYLVDFR
jgi:hypothetical protein